MFQPPSPSKLSTVRRTLVTASLMMQGPEPVVMSNHVSADQAHFPNVLDVRSISHYTCHGPTFRPGEVTEDLRVVKI